MDDSVNSGTLAEAIKEHAIIHNVPTLFTVSPKPDSNNLISYSVELSETNVDETNDHSVARAWNTNTIILVAQAFP
jgi:hypothetical protein